MQKVTITLVATLILVCAISGNSTFAKEPIKAISIEQYFDEGKDRVGTIVYVNGTVSELKFEEDPFSDKKEISSLRIKKGKRNITSIFMKNLPFKTVNVGDHVTIKFKSGAIMGNSELVKGELILGDVQVSTWSSKSKPKLPNLISAEDYFSKELRYGDKRVIFEGMVHKFSKTGAGEVLIEFVTEDGDALVYINRRFWEKKEIRDVLKTLKEGDKVQVKGSFTMEGSMTIFTGETLRKK